MQHFTLNNGLQIPAIGLGTWKAPSDEITRAVSEALAMGYTHIDCAPIYDNEAAVGQALGAQLRSQGIKREQLWLTSKLWNACHLPADVRPACEKTLAELQVDYLDLYLMHWPLAFKPGTAFPETNDDLLSPAQAPLSETWAAMEALVDAGLVKTIGVSNFSAKALDQILPSARIKPAVNQVESHPYLPQRGLEAFCRDREIHLSAYSPLGSGDRPEAFKAPDEKPILQAPEIRAVAEDYGVSPALIILAWQWNRGWSTIPKSTSPERLRLNLSAGKLKLRAEDMARIDDIQTRQRYINPAPWFDQSSPYNSDWVFED